MTLVDLEDRAPGGEGRAFLAVHDMLLAELGACVPPERLAEVMHRVFEALEELGQQQEDPARARADMAEWQRQAEQIVAEVRARNSVQS